MFGSEGAESPSLPAVWSFRKSLARGLPDPVLPLYNDRPKKWTDDPTDRPTCFNGNTSVVSTRCSLGLDHFDNVFWGIRGRTGEARGAIFLWMDSRDCSRVERNVIVAHDSGICWE